MANNNVVTLEEAKEKLSRAIDLTKLFPGFRMPDWVRVGVNEAVEAIRLGQDTWAATVLLKTERGVHNVLASFFRNSAAKFFPNKIAAMEEDGVHQDIRQRAQKKVWELQDLARHVENLDLVEAARLYNETLEVFKWAREEHGRRVKNQGQKDREEELKQAQAQRALELERREEKAADLKRFAETLLNDGVE